MDLTQTHISKLRIKDKHIYIKLIWKQNENDLFHIQVLDGDNNWSGRFSNDFAKSFRERDNLDETEEQYSSNVLKCLSGEAENDNYIFDFTINSKDANTASFSWKKRFNGISVLHGNVPMHRDTSSAEALPHSFIDTLLNKNKDLQNNIKDHSSKIENLISELEKCQNELEKYVNTKASLESTLYGKFVQLLNAKKRRIQLLEDNLLNFEEPNNITMSSDLD